MRKSLITFALTLALLLVSVGIKAQTSTVYLDMDFEDCTTGSGKVPEGWNNQDYVPGATSTTSTTYRWYINSTSTAGFAHSGTKYAFLYANNSYTLVSRLKTPAMSLSSTRSAKVSFWLRNYNSTSASYQVGDFSLYVSTDGGTTYLQNPIVQHVFTGKDWTLYEYSLDAFKGQTINLVFEGVSSGSSAMLSYYYLDDIKVMDAPTCQTPVDPYINNLTGSSATFNWNLDSRFGVTPDQYSVTLKDAAGNVVYHNNAVTASGVNFTNLQGNTQYTASVRSDCDAVSYAGFSDSVSVSFTTLPDAVNPPMFVDFEGWTDIPSGYYYKNATLNTTGSYSYGGTGNSIKLTTTASDNAYFIFPLINLAGNNIEMDFMIRRLAAATTTVKAIQFKVGYLTDPSDVAGSFIPVLSDSIAGDASWRNFRFNTASTQDPTTPLMCCVVIDAAYATSVYLDEVDIHVIPSCTRPEHVTCSNVHANDVTLSWDMANASSFVIKAMSLADSTVTTAVTTQNPYTFTGLADNTEYEFTVKGVCSAADSSQVSRPVAVRTECATAASPIFFEGAENTTGTAIPECWKTDYMLNMSTSTAAPFQSSSTTKIDNRSFAIPFKTSGTISYLCSQPMNFDQSGKYSFRYQMYRPSGTSYNGETLKIFVTPTLGDTTNAVEVIPAINFSAGNAPVTTTIGWNEYEGIINYQGRGYIMAVIYCKNGIQRYIDNLEVFLTPSCPKVSGIELDAVSATTADVTWTPGLNESQWIVDYTLKKGSVNVLDTTFVSTVPAFSVSNLTPASDYTITGNVRAFCGAGDTADAVTFSFPIKTQCLPMAALPFIHDFEDDATGTSSVLPNCWSRFNDASSTTNYYPYVNTSTTSGHSGTKYLYFYGATTTTYAAHQMAVLPAIDTTAYPMNTLRIKFWARKSTATNPTAQMLIGIMSNPTDINTFVTVDSVPVISNEYEQFVVNFDQYVGDGMYVAIRLDRTGTATYCFIDDVTIEPIPNCQDIEGSATVSNNTESSVKITLDDQTAVSAWSYAYGPTGTQVSEMTAVDTAGANIVLTGLTSATVYDLYVRRNCGNGDYSPWSAKVQFSTTAVPATIPYVCGFEDAAENSQWQTSQGDNANNFVVGTVAAAVHNGTQSIYVSADNGATNAYTGTSSRNYAYRTINFGAKGYQIEFYWRCAGGEGSTTIYDYGRVMLLPVSETVIGGAGTNITASNQQAGFPANAIMLNPEEKGYMSLDGSDWHFESFFVNMTAAPGLYNLVLAWNNDGSGGTTNGPLAIDDISITELTCIPPVTIVTSGISSSTASLSVTQATASQWEFIVDTEEFTKDAVPAEPLFRINSTDGTASLTGLTPNTEYFYSVRTICGAGDTSAWLDPASLRTFCAPYAVPYTEGFENAGAANCWSMMTSETDGASVSRATTYHHAGTASLKAVKAAVISPEFTVDSLTHYMITGYAYSTTDSAQFGVGVIVDPNDASTYENISNVLIPVKNTWTEFTAYFTDLADPDFEDFKNANNIVLACGSNTIYFDDIIVDLTPTCPKPTEVTITNITAHSFDISFVDNANVSQWVVYTNGTPNVITTNPATVSGLSASMNYSVSIAAICSATDTSYAADCGTVRTNCDKTSTPWVCGFEATEGYVGATSYNAETTAANFENNCWTVFNQKPGGATYPYTYVSTSSTYVHSGSQGVYTYTSSSATKNLYMMLPDLSDPSNMLKIKVWYKNGSTSTTYADLEFGYWTDPAADTSFVSVYTFPKSSAWVEGEILTNEASYNIPANARIGFMIDRNSTGYGLYLDDISVNLIRNCSDPNAPTVSDITASSAKVTFTDTCATHTAWEYVYGPIGFDPNTATPVSVTTKTFSISGLTSESNYDVYVRAVCGVGDESNYVLASFKTLCMPFSVTAENPFFEDFNNYNYGQYFNTGTCYTVLNEPTTNSYWAKTYPTTLPSATATTFYNYGHSADRFDRCLYWYMFKTSMADGGTFLRQFHLEAGTTYEMSAWVRNGTTNSYEAKVSAMMGMTSSNLDTLASIVITGESVTSRSIDGYSTYPYNEIYQEIKTFITPDSTGDYFIGFNAKHNNTQNYTYLYFDDWSIRAFSGCALKVPSVDSVTTNAAYISINDSDFYQFEYVLNDTALTPTAVNTNVFVISNLSSSTSYTLYIRKYCSATNYSEWISVPFTTECGAVNVFPYTQDFEGDFPPVCWNQFYYNTTTAYKWTSSTSATYVHGGSKAAYISYSTSSGRAALVTGEFNLTAPDGYYVRLWSYRSAPTSYADLSDDALHIGYLNAPITAANINMLNEIGVINRNPTRTPVEPNGEGMYCYEFEVPAGVTGSVWFAFDFHSQNGYYYSIDDITIEPIPSCATPKTAPVVASTTMTTATVTVDMKNKSLAEVAWMATSDLNTVLGSTTTTDGTAIATNLTGNTTYAFKYRFICADGDTSAWSPAGNGTTMSSDCFAPQNLRTVGVVNDHHAAITWGKAPEAVGYQYELKKGNAVVDSAFNNNDTIVYDSLEYNTGYVFRVRTICANDTSAWISLNILTTYPCFSLPFICGFENAEQNNGWQMNKFTSTGSNEFVIGNSKRMSGNSALYVSDDNYSYHYNLSGICLSDAEVLLEIPAGNYYVSYDWTCDGEGTTILYDYGRLFLVPSTADVSTGTYSTYRTSLPAGAISLDDNAPLLKHTDWTNHSEIVTVPNDGVYKLVALWANDGSTGTTDPIAFDNIRIEEISCMPVTSVNMVTVNSNNAQAVVTRYDDDVDVEYALSIYDTEDSVSTWTVAVGDTLSFNNLGTGSEYFLFVRHACSATDKSPVKMVSFLTPNNAMALPFVATFESNDTTVNHWTLTTGCDNNFVIGTGTSNKGSRSLYISDDGSSYSYSGGLSWSYAYIPLQFSVGSFDVSYNWQCYGESTFDYGHVFLAPSSMMPEGNVQLGNMAAATLPAGTIALDADYGKLNLGEEGVWYDASAEVAIPNAGTYNLIVAWHNDASVYHVPPFAIDNISIRQLTCPKLDVSKMTLDSVSTDMIRVKIGGNNEGAGIIYHLASDASFTDTIAYGMTMDSVITVNDLSASTWYYAHLASYCGVGDTSSVVTVRVRTNCGVNTSYPYIEDFESYIASSTEKTQLDDNCWLTSSTSTSAYHYMTTTASYVHGGSKGLYIYNASVSGTIQTFAMPKVDTLAGKRLSMWYKSYGSGATSTYAKLEVGYLTNPDNTNSFVLLETAPLNSNYSEYVVTYPATVPAGARPAFRANGTNYMYVDDIRLNTLVQGAHFNDTICFGGAYNGHGFSCPAGSLAAGDTTLTTVVNASVAAPDTFVTVTVHVIPEIVTVYSDTICAGQPYNFGLFSIPNPETRTYFRTFTSSTGCDSIVTLNLTIEDSYIVLYDTICQGDVYTFNGQQLTVSGDYTAYGVTSRGCSDTTLLHLNVVVTSDTINETICQGTSYTWHGQTYNTSGTYMWTGTGAHGCQLSSVLNLTVLDGSITNDVSICHGGSYQFRDTLITSAGTYTRTYYDVTIGCTVTETINVTVDDVLTADIYDFACEGRQYYGYGISGETITKDTVITVATKTAELCDSVTNVHLTYVATKYGSETVTIQKGETYEWYDNTYSETGNYTETLQSAEGCDSIVTLNLTVIDDVENVRNVKVDVVPNPVRPGMTAYVYGEFGDVEAVEILNNFGQVIDRFAPSSYPIEVQGLETAGLYYVRVITREGDIYTEKLIVK